MKTQHPSQDNQYTTPIKAIPTDYRGVSFRSRLEAKWASFFDLVGWPWQYEPIDLNGYIPDFILTFYEPLLVEVKPELYSRGLDKHCKKIQDSGWGNEALIVGTDIFESEEVCGPYLGIHAEKIKLQDGSLEWCWDPGIFHKCAHCGKWSLHNSTQSWRCRVAGCYEGNSYLVVPEYEEVRRMFAVASSLVQYNA